MKNTVLVLHIKKKLNSMTIPKFTKSLTIKMVANNFSGLANSPKIRLSQADFDSASSSSWVRVKEKNAISEPDAKAEHIRRNTAINNATIALTDGAVTYPSGSAKECICAKAVRNVSKISVLFN